MSDQVEQQPVPARGGVGRRAAAASGRRWGAGALAALLLPAAALGAAALASEGQPPTPAAAPDEVPLPAADLGCAALPPGPARAGDPPVLVSRAAADEAVADDDAVVRVGAAGDPDRREVEVGAGELVAAAGGPAATVVAGRGAAAPGLLAARPWAPAGWAPCAPPVPEVWFAGVGAGAEHASVLELVNPDAGDAVVDVAVLGPTGPLEVDDVRGVRVPGRSSVQLDLAALVPSRDELALRVVVARGRATALLRDRVDDLGRTAPTVDLAAPQAAPAEDVHLLGLPEGAGERVLTVANPGEDQVRVELAVVTDRSTFVPVGLEELSVAPGAVEAVDLGEVLGREVARGALGVRVRAAAPVVASLRQVVAPARGAAGAAGAAAAADLAHAAPAPAVRSGAVLLPDLPGDPAHRLVLVAADGGATTAVVTVRAADGRELRRREVDVAPGAGTALRLPGRAVRVEVEAGAPVLGATLSTTRAGAAVQPLTEPATSALLPQVRPAP